MATPATPSNLQTTNDHIALRVLPGMEELPGDLNQPKSRWRFTFNKKWFHITSKPPLFFQVQVQLVYRKAPFFLIHHCLFELLPQLKGPTSMQLKGPRWPVIQEVKKFPAVNLVEGNEDSQVRIFLAKECHQNSISNLYRCEIMTG